ncbi:hypothetical protein GQ651_16805 [Alphaproteobacteria bacterium GH1-50]|uniref:Uncharacterized protein n=1 Tax=Kangsaoukella pontilimi TaxID=2691042 RepID=A0A7C9II41_9RHOB|nr:hypothetical protein [Kangsaoukella pontilimi]MXQ09508.1 hypothetical protein [Kangsaoukella pontilimi]
MTAAVLSLFGSAPRDDAVPAPQPSRRRAADWPLMGDIVSHRAGVPVHLIRWLRAEGEDDPAPML